MDKYEQAIKRIQYFLGDNQDCACIECGMQEICSRENDGLCPLQLAIQGIDALRTQQERENPKPLIESELLRRIDKPIFVVHGGVSEWVIMRGCDGTWVKFYGKSDLSLKAYIHSWIAYDHEPKE